MWWRGELPDKLPSGHNLQKPTLRKSLLAMNSLLVREVDVLMCATTLWVVHSM